LFLPWVRAAGWFAYEPVSDGAPRELPALTGWEIFVTLDVLLVACALAAIAGSARLAAAAAWVALLAVTTRLVGFGFEVGIAVGLAASALMLARGGVPGWRPQRDDAVAVAGGVLVFSALFLPWYGIEVPRGVNRLFSEPLSAWEAFELTPVALTVAAAVAIARRQTAAAAAAIALVAYALLSTPDIRYGAWLGLAGAVVLLVGTLQADPTRMPALG
jgi:hypothetical protein